LKIPIFCLVLLLFIQFSAGAQDHDNAGSASADDLLNDVVARLPSDPLEITGELTVRRRKGVVKQKLGFSMNLDLGSVPSKAIYRITDGSGARYGKLEVRRTAGGAASYIYFNGEDTEPGSLPELSTRILASDVSWADLTLSFLWWRGGRRMGDEEVIGRKCHIVEVDAPDSDRGSYSRVRLWIDVKHRMLLRAQAFHGEKPARTLWVRSLRKINDRWMIKDMEIQEPGSSTRTKLTVHDLKETGTGESADAGS
jgi:hypothetical protein